MASYELGNARFDEAKKYAERAIAELTTYNTRTESGEAYYVYAQILEACGEFKKAYDFYYKAAYAADSIAKAMTRIALLDIRLCDYVEAARHANWALDYGRNNSLATAALIIALKEQGRADEAANVAKAHKHNLYTHISPQKIRRLARLCVFFLCTRGLACGLLQG
jgi:tetratricopeptide (TPR) repeat protein